MRLFSDNRAQSIQIGAVLLFGILIVLLATWQAFVIPDQNEEVEFNHNEELQQQMTDLRSTANSMPNTLSTRSVTLDLGLRYPTRTIFRNPSPVSGTIGTVGTDDGAFNLTINNARALENNVGDFWDGSEQSYETGAVEYRPNYNLYNNAPESVYEHSVMFNRFRFEESTLPRTGQALVRDDRITVVAIDGDLQEERVESTSVDIEPISTDTRRVQIEDDDGPVTIELVTGLAEQRWENILREERVNRGGNVESISTTPLADTDRELLTIELAEGVDYTLQMAKVGFGSGASETDKAYLTDVEGDDSSIQRGNNQRLVVEVRDKFNNPKRGVEVSASAEGGQFSDGNTETSTNSDSDGQASFRYTGQQSGENNINFTIADGYQPQPDRDHQANAPENVTMTVDVQSPPSGGAGGSAFNVSWIEPELPESNGVFEYNVTEEGEPLDLIAETDRATEGASIEYAVSDTSIGTLTGEETTSGDRELDVTFDPEAEGEIDLFVSGGGSGDRLEIEVIDISDEDDGPADVDALNAEFEFEERTNTQLNPITVQVEDSDENRVEGEEITLEVTQGDGNFLINGGNQGPEVTVTTDTDGEFEDTVEYSTDVFPESVEVTLEDESGDVTETITSEVTAPISGTVEDEDGAIIEGADITVTNTNTEDERTTQTASDGSYSIEVPVGEYDVEADADGFNAETQVDNEVENGEEGITVDFVLLSSPARFVAGDVGEDDDSQTFAFDTDGTSNNQDGVIDLSDPQNAGGVDYTGLDEDDLASQAPGNDDLRYNEEDNEIVYDVGGQPDVDRLEITVNSIDVLGDPGETYTVEYTDSVSDSDDFTIESAGG